MEKFVSLTSSGITDSFQARQVFYSGGNISSLRCQLGEACNLGNRMVLTLLDPHTASWSNFQALFLRYPAILLVLQQILCVLIGILEEAAPFFLLLLSTLANSLRSLQAGQVFSDLLPQQFQALFSFTAFRAVAASLVQASVFQ